jgi:hypothetical protein
MTNRKVINLKNRINKLFAKEVLILAIHLPSPGSNK